jgi:hypothetical protein
MKPMEVVYHPLKRAPGVGGQALQLGRHADNNRADGIRAAGQLVTVDLACCDQQVDVTHAKRLRELPPDLHLWKLIPAPLEVGNVGLRDPGPFRKLRLGQLQQSASRLDEFGQPVCRFDIFHATPPGKSRKIGNIHDSLATVYLMRISHAGACKFGDWC